MQEHAAALDTHVVIETGSWERLEDIKDEIKRMLESQFGIAHSTLEFERQERAHQNASLYGHGGKEDDG
jgi:cobalt-zinc-cadmium efflux system protein